MTQNSKIMNPISYLFFVLLLFTFWPHPIQTNNTTNGPDDLINKACENAIYKDLCKSSLQSASQSKQPNNLNDLARTALNLALSNATDIYMIIYKLVNTTFGDSIMQQCLKDCTDNYEDAMDQLENSLVGLDLEGYNDVNTWVTAAMADAESCDDGFKNRPGYNCPFTNTSSIFSQLCSNVLAITKLLDGV